MIEQSYEFDPCEIDGSNEEPMNLDAKGEIKNPPKIVLSQWRQNAIGESFNQQPGIDDLHKIHRFLKKKTSDSDIMKAFGITAETLIAIKRDKYDPVEGISLDNQSKIYKRFKLMDARIEGLLRAINYIGKIIFIEKKELSEFKKSFKKPKIAKDISKIKSPKNNQNDILESFCDIDEEMGEQNYAYCPEEE